MQQLACKAVQEIRIKHRWQATEEESRQMQSAKEQKMFFSAQVLENGDTLKQLLARSRYLLYKKPYNWSESQVYRAEILFKLYSDIEEAYGLSRGLSDIFTYSKERIVAFKKLALWYNQVEKAAFDSFNTIARTIQNHYEKILNFFVEEVLMHQQNPSIARRTVQRLKH